MRTSTGLHANNAIGRQRVASNEELHVLSREDVVGDHSQSIVIPHALAEHINEGGFAGAYRAADAKSNRPVASHDLNSRDSTYCWLMTMMSMLGANDVSGRSSASTAEASAGTR